MELEHHRPELGTAEQIESSIYWLRTLSTIGGLWPEKLAGGKKIWWNLLYYFMVGMHWFNFYVQVEFLFANLRELMTITEGLCTLFTVLVTGIKMMRLHSFSDEIYEMLQLVKGYELLKSINFLKKGNNNKLFDEVDKIMSDKWREIKLNLRFYTVSIGMAAASYSILPAVINLINLFQGNDIPRRFVYKSYYRFLEEAKYKSPLHELLFCTESVLGLTTLSTCIAFEGLYILLTMHLVAMFRALYLMIQEISNENFTDEEKQFFLHECINHHARALKFLNGINEIFSPVLLVQVFTSTTIICVIAFHTGAHASEHNSQILVMISYLYAALFQLLQFCWYGQRVQNESVQLANSVYDCDWYRGSAKFKSTFIIFWLDAQKTIGISACNLFEMTLETYLTIIRTAASYFTILRTLTEEK